MEKILKDIRDLLTPSPPIGTTFQISDTQAYNLDYKNRKYIYIFTPTGITLSFEDLKNITTTSASWTNISFKSGTRVFAPNNATPVTIFVLCTNDQMQISSGGGAVTIADGADVAEGATTDVAVTGDSPGSNSAKLRGLSKIFADVWDSVNHVLGVKATQSGTWTITANAGTNLNTSALALESGGNLATIAGAVSASKVQVQQSTSTSGGSTPFHALSAASNNATSVKASAGQLYGITISNTNAAARFFKLYNKASAPAPATDNALIVLTIQIPANSTVVHAFPEGMSFSTGIAFAAVANISDTDNTAIGASDLSMDLRYK